jgi:tetratricopeptide (TPR) repeat protein
MSALSSSSTRPLSTRLRCHFLLVAILLAIAPSSRAQVRVWQGVLEIPVYEEGAPDPNPSFDQFAGNRFNYPYTLRTEITDHRVAKKLRAVYLENEYLKCSVLPDIGGHVYTCIDKINGQPMFYANPSIKKARIGYRGAWAAFGIEFNFPVSHNWVSMSPVNFAFGQHPDGSASITVGNIDRVYGMEWCVELILRPGSSVLEERVRLSNRSDVRHRFYWWNNAAVRVWDDSHVEYPMRFAATHGFAEVQPWPVDSTGKDLSVIKNETDGPVSLFVHGSREEFMGIWNPHTNTGIAHFADYASLPAKKIWSWGVDPDGLDWRKVLSDDNSAYAEVQAGLFRNQETYAFLEPRRSIEFSEYWAPVRDTGGISRANTNGIVHLERSGSNLEISLNVNRRIPAARIQLLDEKKSLLAEKVDLAPDKTWKSRVQVPNQSRKYTFVLSSADSIELLRQTEGTYDWVPESEISVGLQKNYVFPEVAARSEDDWLQFGNTAELNSNLLAAAQTYRDALSKFPASYELMKAAGRLDAALYRFDEALPVLAAAHGRNTTDAEVSYYLGIAYEGVAREREAANAYEAAMRSPIHRSAAALQLGELTARQGDLRKAVDLLTESARLSEGDFRAAEERIALLRAAGKSDLARRLASDLIVRDVLSDFLREEIGNPDLAHLSADPYRVLAVATQYANLGLYRKALDVVSRQYPRVDSDRSEPGTVLPQENPLVVYFRGYCQEKLGETGAADFAIASQLSTLYVFPSTLAHKQALEAALGSNVNDATAHYLLGTWYFARAKTSEALREWQSALKLNPKMPALQASLGLALLHVQHDSSAAREVFEQGIQADPRNVVNYFGSVAASALLGKSPQTRVQTLERYPDLKHMPTPLVYELALNRAEAGDFNSALELFHDRFFGREEGGTNVRQVWIEVNLLRAQALAKKNECTPAVGAVEQLASPVPGMAFTQDGMETFANTARANYVRGEVLAACGKLDQASRYFAAASRATATTDLLWAWAAVRRQTGFDAAQWQTRLSSAASKAKADSERSSNPSWWLYNAGALQVAAGKTEEGQSELREALLQPETQMSHHFARLVLEGLAP